MILHFIFNTVFIFTGFAALIELFLFVFRIKHARLRYLCRLLPLLKIPVDFMVFFFFDRGFFFNFNPFSCEAYMFNFFHLHLSPFALDVMSFTVVTLALCGIFRKACAAWKALSERKKILLHAIPCHRDANHPALNRALETVKIFSSSEISVPCATTRNTILFPALLLERFTQEEFEAVLAHELAHLRWKDPYVNLGLHLICCFFWWIPTKWWTNRLFMEQEKGCDVDIHRYDLAQECLASALVKTAKFSKQLEPIAAFFTSKRIYAILEAKDLRARCTLYSLCGVVLCGVSFFSFWMC